MLELVFYVWLLGAAFIFVGVALSGEASDRFEGLWLLALAASWPLVLVFKAFGAMLLMIAAAVGIRR